MINHWLRISLFLLLWSNANMTQAVMAGEHTAAAQKLSSSEQANKGLVGIIAGGVNGTYIPVSYTHLTLPTSDLV